MVWSVMLLDIPGEIMKIKGKPLEIAEGRICLEHPVNSGAPCPRCVAPPASHPLWLWFCSGKLPQSSALQLKIVELILCAAKNWAGFTWSETVLHKAIDNCSFSNICFTKEHYFKFHNSLLQNQPSCLSIESHSHTTVNQMSNFVTSLSTPDTSQERHNYLFREINKQKCFSTAPL